MNKTDGTGQDRQTNKTEFLVDREKWRKSKYDTITKEDIQANIW